MAVSCIRGEEMYTAGLGARILTALEDDQKFIHVLSGGNAGERRVGKADPFAVFAREHQHVRLLHTVNTGDSQCPMKQALVEHAFCQRPGERERVRLRKHFVVQRIFGNGLRKFDRRLRRYDNHHHKI